MTRPDLTAPLFREPGSIDKAQKTNEQAKGKVPLTATVGKTAQEDGKWTSSSSGPALCLSQKAAIRLYKWLQPLVSALVLVLLMFLFVVKIIGIEGSSMLPTLKNGDYILATAGLLSTPKQGSVVVLKKESFISDPIVKRVIATAGQTVDIDFAAGTVRVDGKLLNEPYILEKTHMMYDVSFPVKVPEGCVFVLGDNRNKSTDSRYSGVGMVDNRYIMGRVLMVLAPLGRIGAVQ
ncbi:MAG: signal peptidase I [Oscillospiraceae bacterium]|nr:signal peptidase I [Oscillospiraceae bacterium]